MSRMQTRWIALAGFLLVALVVGCGSPVPSQVPAVTVHVVNQTSNVVVTSVNLHPGGWIGNPPTDGYGFVAPCVGAVDLRAPIEHNTGGSLGLLIDPDGQLDREYPSAILVPAEAPGYGLSIIWSNAELREGEWITVTSSGVLRSTAAPETIASPPPCAAWVET
jgi:hypothetical protein